MTTTINQSPKQRFLQSADAASKHRTLVESREFQRGCDYSLLQYQSILARQSVDGSGAAAAHFKMMGVQEFLETFRLLAEAVPQIRVSANDNLTQT